MMNGAVDTLNTLLALDAELAWVDCLMTREELEQHWYEQDQADQEAAFWRAWSESGRDYFPW